DKNYSVIIPGIRDVKTIAVVTKKEPEPTRLSPNMSKYPVIREAYGKNTRIIRINGIQGVIGKNGDDIQELATLGGISIGQFLKYNDIAIDHKIRDGQAYYIKPKKRKAKEYYHTILPGENLWIISQKYGIKLDQLWMKNRMKNDDPIKNGMVLYIRYIRPENEEIAYNPIPSVSSIPVAVSQEIRDTLDVLNQDARFVKNDIRELEFQESLSSNIEKDQDPGEEEAKSNSVLENENNTTPDTLSMVPLLHVVSEGETLYGIAKKYNMPISLLMEINEIGPGESIKTGQQLYLKIPEPGIEIADENEQNNHGPYISYEVRKGDTLYNLSKKFNVSVEEIMDWNKKDSMQLNIGEKLKIFKRSNE
ncbi:MAG TPA: LysM peptidoglycan-binding domain-containing protein, partial [Cyclobacteriaceae bacterium]|nr:LysM peptidoglycan-binding domain-containing protein [Cyclobacteriaceae bacterium]